MNKYDYDLIILGGGAAGLVATKFALGLGKSVAIIEKNKIGGECTLTGCVPSKTLINSAAIAHQVHHLKKYGLQNSTEINLDTTSVMTHVQQTVDRIYQTHTPEKIERLGATILFGAPVFIDQHTIRLDDKKITADKIIIATGSSPFIPPIEGIQDVGFLTNENLFSLKEIPSSMVIVGGGPIGIEMASALNRLGCKITIVEINPNILPQEDEELTKPLAMHLRNEGISLNLNTQVTRVEQTGTHITVHIKKQNNEQATLSTEKILIATGRKPNIEHLDCQAAGIRYTKRGIITNKKMHTSAKNIFACGDVTGPLQFSHMADYQAVIATHNAFIPFFKRKAHYADACWVTFCSPELARFGLTEKQAHEKYGKKIHIYRVDYNHIDRPITDGNTFGLAKIICDKKQRIIGAHILGARAGELIHELQVARKNNITLAQLNKLIHAYPTYNDVLKKAARLSYIQKIQSNFFIQIFKRLSGRK